MNDNTLKAFPYTGAGTDGMDLRDYFAAKALQGVCSISVDDWPEDWKDNQIAPMHHAAKACYLLADAMMKARENHE